MSNSRGCETKTKLLMAYQDATSSYSNLVLELSRALGKLSPAEYSTLHSKVEEARKISQATRSALDEHALEHGC
jgi:hypothetical protein